MNVSIQHMLCMSDMHTLSDDADVRLRLELGPAMSCDPKLDACASLLSTTQFSSITVSVVNLGKATCSALKTFSPEISRRYAGLNS